MDQIKIGKFICNERKRKGLTQQELADELGVSNRTVGNWENGRNMPDLSLFEPLCAVLDITLTELFNGDRIKQENIKEKADEVIMDMIKNRKINSLVSIIASIFMAVGIILFFIPSIKEFTQGIDLLTISIGVLFLLIGFYLKTRFVKK